MMRMRAARSFIPDIPIKIEKVDIACYSFAQHIARDDFPVESAPKSLPAVMLRIWTAMGSRHSGMQHQAEAGDSSCNTHKTDAGG